MALSILVTFSINISKRSKLPAGAGESSSSPKSDNEDDLVAEVSDQSEESVTLSTSDDSIQTEGPEFEDVKQSK